MNEIKALAKIHDKALNHEHDILIHTEQLSELRIKMYEKRDKEELVYIIPVLNALISEAKKYKEWIKTEVSHEINI